MVPRPEHSISRRQISPGALKVLYRLHRAGYLAYLVGGSVRDLLLGRTPKDFDVVTNARPREIRRLFRNSRIIGRRFRLVHVMFAGEIVEVATFRASPEPPEVPDGWEEDEAGEVEENGAVAAENNNHFGTPAEDAARRDFTVNALFYNIADFSIIDYVGGLADLEARVLRVIGDPGRRFREDPVRMLRALEYMVRLGFELGPGVADAIHEHREEILNAAPARLAYELLETLRSGVAAGICPAWARFGILDLVFPEAAQAGARLTPLLEVLDRWAVASLSVPDAVLLGTAFLPEYTEMLQRLTAGVGRVDNVALIDGIAELVKPAIPRLHLSHYTVHLIRQGLFTMSKLRRPPERARQVQRLARQDYFSAAWAFDTLAVEAGLLPREPHVAWERALRRLAEQGEGREEPARRRPRRRRPRRRRRP